MKNEIQNDQNKQALMKVSLASLWRLTGSFFFLNEIYQEKKNRLNC